MEVNEIINTDEAPLQPTQDQRCDWRRKNLKHYGYIKQFLDWQHRTNTVLLYIPVPWYKITYMWPYRPPLGAALRWQVDVSVHWPFFLLPLLLCVSVFKSDTHYSCVYKNGWTGVFVSLPSTTSPVAVTPHNGNNLQHGCWFREVNGTSVLVSARKCSTKSWFCHR